MSDLQKIVVLCTVGVLIVAGFVFLLLAEPANAPENLEGENLPTKDQIDPPSMEIESGPEDTEPTEEPGEPSLQPSDVGMEFPIPDSEQSPVACTTDAKACPDGSFVGRVSPSCEFAPCPEVDETQAAESFEVRGTNYAYDVEEIKVKEGTEVTITFISDSGFHDWVVDEFDAATERVNAGEGETSVTFVADKTGTFEYYCSVGSHRARGMVGTLVVE